MPRTRKLGKKVEKRKNSGSFGSGHFKGAANLTHLDSRETLWHKEGSADGAEFPPPDPLKVRACWQIGTAARLSAGPECSRELSSYWRSPDGILIYARSCAGRHRLCSCS